MNLPKIAQVSIIFMALVVFFVILHQFQGFLRPFFVAVILSFLFVPLTRMSRETKRTIWLTTAGIIVALFFIVFVLSSIFVEDTAEDLPTQGDSKGVDELISSKSLTFFGEEHQVSALIDFERISEMIQNSLSSLLSAVSGFFTEFFLVLIFMFFLLPSHDITLNRICQDLTPQGRKKFSSTLEQIEKSIRSYLTIKTMTSLATAALSGIVMLAFGVKFTMLFMLLIFFLNFIPTFGSIVAVTIVLVAHFFTADFSALFFVLAFLLTSIQIIIGNIIEPKYTGKGLELSPVIILLSLFFWGTVWGVGGMFFAVPLTAIIKIILQNIDATKDIVTYLK